MASAAELVPMIKKWEGGFVNDPDDPGGATNQGVTIKVFQSYYPGSTVEDLKKITNEQWTRIFKTGYWDPCKADSINNQSIANILVDWAYNSGRGTAIKQTKKALGITPLNTKCDNSFIEFLNSTNSYDTFNTIKKARIKFVEDIVVRRPKSKKFLKGWKIRINSYKYIGDDISSQKEENIENTKEETISYPKYVWTPSHYSVPKMESSKDDEEICRIV